MPAISPSSSEFSTCPIPSSSPTFCGAVLPPIPTSPVSSSESARVIDLRPETSLLLWVWWAVLHGVVLAAIALVGGPWLLKAAAAIAALAHSIVFRPRHAPSLVFRAGRVAVPELELEDLALGRRTRHCGLWVRLELRGRGRVLDILLLADQVDPMLWRTLRAELARLTSEEAASGNPGRPDLR